MEPALELKVTYRSSPNIAWVKYWGKYDEDYILPINDSLGVTLNSSDIFTVTTISFSQKNKENKVILNNQEHAISKRMNKMFNFIKDVAYHKAYKQHITLEQWSKFNFKVQSNNSFPTASGMASSASGLACLAVGLNGLFGGNLSENQVSQLARLGSGSASRSVCGGLVRWKGVQEALLNQKMQQTPEVLKMLSKQCISFTVMNHTELQKIKVLILLAHNKQKQISSTSGMQTSVKTSELIKYRNGLANNRISIILQKLQQFNKATSRQQQVQAFNCIAQSIIKDSNQFHAICLDTYPPIFYLNQFSKQIINVVDKVFNTTLDFKVAYTFDAGPHAFLFMHESVQQTVIKYFQSMFQLPQTAFNKKLLEKLKKSSTIGGQMSKLKKYQGSIIKPHQIWSTTIGCGAYKIE